MKLRKSRESSAAMLKNASSGTMKPLAQGGHQVLANTADSPVDAARKPRSLSSAPPSLGGGQGTPPPTGSSRESSEKGFTLQTLIVTAVLVLVAVGAALVLVAINRSSSDDFEAAGNIGIEGKCQTWEIHVATLEAAGHGGPEGHGGVASSNIGCLAPCYWDVTGNSAGGAIKTFYPLSIVVRNQELDPDTGERGGFPNPSKLIYYDDNRPPAKNQYRLGVVYSRGGDIDHRASRPGWAKPNMEGHETILRWTPRGVETHPGTPVAQNFLDRGWPLAAKPNWVSIGPDPGNVLPINAGLTTSTDRADLAKYTWEDEYWEVRADPGREVCEIVNVAHDDLLVCSSAKDECEPINT